MLVYRVARETKSGEIVGPYQTGAHSQYVSSKLEEMYSQHWDSSHPTPQLDFPPYYMDQNDLCGFSSLEMLNSWFDGYLPLLDSCGFQMYVYDVDDDFCYELEHQTVFTVKWANLYMCLPLI